MIIASSLYEQLVVKVPRLNTQSYIWLKLLEGGEWWPNIFPFR